MVYKGELHMKKLAIVIVIASVTVLVFAASCSEQPEPGREPTTIQSTPSETSSEFGSKPLNALKYNRSTTGLYSIEKRLFSMINALGNEVWFEYPIIAGLEDRGKQEQLNALIFSAAFGLLDCTTRYDGSGFDVWWFFELTYRITLSTPDIISIVYEGYSQQDTSAFGGKVSECITIDINTLHILRLHEFVNISGDTTAKRILNSENYSFAGSVTGYDGYPDIWLGEEEPWHQMLYSVESVADYLNSRGDYTNYYYLTENSICVSLWLGHNEGDYLWVEIPVE